MSLSALGRALISAPVLLALVGCSGSTAEHVGPELPRWEDVTETLVAGLDEDSSNPCQRGDRSCFDIVMAEMSRRLEPLADACDHDALFATMYLRMTEQVRDAYDDGRLENPAFTSHLTAWFAGYYFRAYDDWHGGDTDAVPEAWRIAFEAADEETVRGLGNLLLGMNAHVSRDLPYVVADVLDAPLAEIDPDYALVNGLIADLSAGLVSEVADRYDPTLQVVLLPLGLGGDSVGEVVRLWRTESWEKGMSLLRSDGSTRDGVVDQIEADAVSRTEIIMPQVAYLPVIEDARPRDKYCRDHR
jgi:hypothetical protein